MSNQYAGEQIAMSQRVKKSTNPPENEDFWLHSPPGSPELAAAAAVAVQELHELWHEALAQCGSLASLHHGVQLNRYDLEDVRRLYHVSEAVLADLTSVRSTLEGRSRASAAFARRARSRQDQAPSRSA